MGSGSRLPIELLEIIFAFLPAHDQLRASRTCSAWRNALLGLKHLFIPVSPALCKFGINDIIKSFPLLESVEVGCPKEIFSNRELTSPEMRWMLDAFAGTFHGSQRIKTIICPSQAILNGAAKCPRLERLVVRAPPEYFLSSQRLTGMAGNVHGVIQNCRKLRRIEMNDTVFWKRSPSAFEQREALEELVISGIAKWSFHALMRWMNGGADPSESADSSWSANSAMLPGQAIDGVRHTQLIHSLPTAPRLATLPGLRKFSLVDAMYLPVPFIDILQAAAPNLRKLRFKHVTFGPEHLLKICTPEWQLESLELECCELYDVFVQCLECRDSVPVGLRFPRLVRHITSRMPTIQNVTFAHCAFKDVQISSSNSLIIALGVAPCAHHTEDAVVRPRNKVQCSALRSLTILPLSVDPIDGPSIEAIERDHPMLSTFKVNAPHALKQLQRTARMQTMPSNLKELEIWCLKDTRTPSTITRSDERNSASMEQRENGSAHNVRLYPFLEHLTFCTPKDPYDFELLLHEANAGRLKFLSLRYLPDKLIEHYTTSKGRVPTLPNLKYLEVSVHESASEAFVPFLIELVAAARDPTSGKTKLEIVKVEYFDSRATSLSAQNLIEAVSMWCPSLKELHVSGLSINVEDLQKTGFLGLRRLLLKNTFLGHHADASWWFALSSFVESREVLRSVEIHCPLMQKELLKKIYQDTVDRVGVVDSCGCLEAVDPAFRAATILALAESGSRSLGHELLDADEWAKAGGIEGLSSAAIVSLAAPVLACNLRARFLRLEDVSVFVHVSDSQASI